MGIKKFEKAITKTAKEMKAGDVFRTEYGDHGNWCNFVFESCKAHSKTTTEITFHRIGRKESDRCYEITPIDKVTFEVIGVEVDELQEVA